MASIFKYLCRSMTSVKDFYLNLNREDKAIITSLFLSESLFAYALKDDNTMLLHSQFVVTLGSVSVGALTGWLIHVYSPASYLILGLPLPAILFYEIMY